MSAKIEDDPALRDLGKAEFQKLEAGDAENRDDQRIGAVGLGVSPEMDEAKTPEIPMEPSFSAAEAMDGVENCDTPAAKPAFVGEPKPEAELTTEALAVTDDAMEVDITA